jgi:hypothetical protein
MNILLTSIEICYPDIPQSIWQKLDEILKKISGFYVFVDLVLTKKDLIIFKKLVNFSIEVCFCFWKMVEVCDLFLFLRN